MARPLFHDPHHERALREEGFVVTKLMEPEEAAAVLARYRSLRPADGFRPDGTGVNRARYHCTFLDDDRDYKAASLQIVEQEFRPRIDRILDRCSVLTGNLYVKPPGAGKLEIHQNWNTTPDVRSTSVTVWCPLVDVGPANGTLQVVPRSHKIIDTIAAASASQYFIPMYDALIERWLQPVPAIRAGECVVFDDSLLHWGDDNGLDSDRWALQVVMVPEEHEKVVFYFDADHVPPRFEYFAVDSAWYVDHQITDLLTRPEGLTSLGFMERTNQQIDEWQFERLMELGPETRARVYAGEPVETAFPPIPRRSLGEWADVAADDLDAWSDAVDRIYAGTLDGMVIRGVADAAEMAIAVAHAERYRDEFKDHGKQIMFGTPLVGAADDRSDYLADAWRINDRLGELFDFDFSGRIADVLSAVGSGRPAEVPQEDSGRSYVPLTFRFLPPTGGVMHAHTANEFCNVWHAYDYLRETARMWNSLSYFVVAEQAEEGGDLVLYDLQWDETPDEILALPMSEERDQLLAAFGEVPISPRVGDMILFTGGRIWHRVSPVTGRTRRVTIGGFVAVSNDDRRIYYWS